MSFPFGPIAQPPKKPKTPAKGKKGVKTKLVPKKTKQQYVPAGGGDDYDCPCELDEPLSCPEVLGVQFDFNTPLTAKDCKWIGALNAMVAEDESAPPIPMRKCSMPQWSESKAQATKRTAQFKALTTYKKASLQEIWTKSILKMVQDESTAEGKDEDEAANMNAGVKDFMHLHQRGGYPWCKTVPKQDGKHFCVSTLGEKPPEGAPAGKKGKKAAEGDKTITQPRTGEQFEIKSGSTMKNKKEED